MKARKIKLFKKGYYDFINGYDDINGKDVVSFYYNNLICLGEIDKSPLMARFKEEFSLSDEIDESKKSYRAHWIITESKLYLCYVNGIFDGKRYFTSDLIPEYPDDLIMYNYQDFSEEFHVDCKLHELKENSKDFVNYDIIRIHFAKGVVNQLVFITAIV